MGGRVGRLLRLLMMILVFDDLGMMGYVGFVRDENGTILRSCVMLFLLDAFKRGG